MAEDSGTMAAALHEEEESTTAASSNEGREQEEEDVCSLVKDSEPNDEDDAFHGCRDYFDRLRQAAATGGDQVVFQKSAFTWASKAGHKDVETYAEQGCDVDVDGAARGKVNGQQLRKFGYVAGLAENAPFARFDIRDKTCLSVGGLRHGQVVQSEDGKDYVVVGVKPYKGKPRLWFQPKSLKRRASCTLDDSQILKPKGVRQRLREACLNESGVAEDSDGEQVRLCRHCHLPLGDLGYVDREQRKSLAHGECMAQVLLRESKTQQKQRLQKEEGQKQSRREAYDIGWTSARIPCNATTAEQLNVGAGSHGMYCVVLDEEKSTVTIDATWEPSASINLEYLALALKCRVLEDSEPWFSLDPLDPEACKTQKEGSMQVKKFQPQWLEGTSVGEVMFQADYHLKELSMGECRQPVVGLKSCKEMPGEFVASDSWTAREWFMVRNAEVYLTQDGAVIPRVQLAVEAREQVSGPDGLQDAPITQQHHPLVKYAKQFSRCFDLIAERTSSVFHLRELAKASVVAKFLVDADVNVDGLLIDQPQAVQATTGCTQIPQLWNEQLFPVIEVRDGRIVDGDGDGEGGGSKVRSVYGGIDFGLDRFVGGAPLRPSAVAWAAYSPGFAPRPPDVPVQPLLPLTITTPTIAPGAPAIEAPRPPVRAVTGVTVAPSAGRPAPEPRVERVPGRRRRRGPRRAIDVAGVNMDLDAFDLTEAGKLESAARANSEEEPALSAGGIMSTLFWDSLEAGKSSLMGDAEKKLFQEVFNPCLSDRREDGAMFVPPEADPAYLQHLRTLVKEEAAVRQTRRSHFLSTDFNLDQPGPLFPGAWKASAEQSARLGAGQSLHPRPELVGETIMTTGSMRSAAPCFDEITEDGMRFRIYSVGGLQVRTTQAPSQEEVVGAVFSVRKAQWNPTEPCMQIYDDEVIVKVTQYVEQPSDKSHHLSYYITLETDRGSALVMERLSDGRARLDGVVPAELEDRNSLARVLCSSSCSAARDMQVLVRDMHRFQRLAEVGQTSHSARKRFARRAYDQARGMARLQERSANRR